MTMMVPMGNPVGETLLQQNFCIHSVFLVIFGVTCLCVCVCVCICEYFLVLFCLDK